MNRERFTLGACAASFAAVRAAATAATSFALASPARPGLRLTLAQLVASYPAAVSGDVVQYELGFGAAYDKQIGFGHEGAGDDRYTFVETQVGNGDHACNPNTLKKVYLKSRRFANAFTPYPASVYVTRSGSMLTRWGDGVGPSAADVLLLDSKLLYRRDRATIRSVRTASVRVGRRTLATSHVTATFGGNAPEALRTVELWLSPEVPLGLVKMRATAVGLDPFHLELYSFARTFRTLLPMSLATVRALTPSGGEIPVLQ